MKVKSYSKQYGERLDMRLLKELPSESFETTEGCLIIHMRSSVFKCSKFHSVHVGVTRSQTHVLVFLAYVISVKHKTVIETILMYTLHHLQRAFSNVVASVCINS